MQVPAIPIWPERSGLKSVRSGALVGSSLRLGTPICDDGEAVVGQDWVNLIGAVAARQDRRAFAALFEFYVPRIKTLLVRMGATAEVAEDIAQETLLTVWRKAAYYDPNRASASAWIYAIARNLRIDRLRRDQRSRLHALYELVEAEGPERPDELLDDVERDHRVRFALEQLSDEQLRVVQLAFFGGRAHGAIAALLDIPLGTVKSRLRLAMSRLREFLGDLT
jgi:RNA polymerase sigma-70 factor (ECF subfamily)